MYTLAKNTSKAVGCDLSRLLQDFFSRSSLHFLCTVRASNSGLVFVRSGGLFHACVIPWFDESEQRYTIYTYATISRVRDEAKIDSFSLSSYVWGDDGFQPSTSTPSPFRKKKIFAN